jgi:predicted nicotinamide N-methyase
LFWGENLNFRERLGAGKKFDVLFAADVIYEAEQVSPLISSVVEFLHGALLQTIF